MKTKRLIFGETEFGLNLKHYPERECALSDTNYAVIYDLHSHTTASDGCLTPEALVHRAVDKPGSACNSRAKAKRHLR
ncbi:hypothetical protein D5281_23925 [bacterium 1xD42-62]|uniref:Uncharacterized protein n=2 Tax=Parablautia muri TaxID=2320879 RepID=A0A9X5BMI0_9FIRM|nr:hypothetical protein [Parablautia muri]